MDSGSWPERRTWTSLAAADNAGFDRMVSDVRELHRASERDGPPRIDPETGLPHRSHACRRLRPVDPTERRFGPGEFTGGSRQVSSSESERLGPESSDPGRSGCKTADG